MVPKDGNFKWIERTRKRLETLYFETEIRTEKNYKKRL